MEKSFTLFFLVAIGIFLVFFIPTLSRERLLDRVQGRVLLQVESAGEAWYVHPKTRERYFLGRPEDAFRVMREQSLGMNNADLTRLFGALPTDGAQEFVTAERALAERLAGMIVLNVEGRGEAYYLNPVDLRGYALGHPKDAFRVMQSLGLGISNRDIGEISSAEEKPLTPHLFCTDARASTKMRCTKGAGLTAF